MRILLVDDHVPYPELGVGYPRARNLLHALHALGHSVVLVPLESSGEPVAVMRRVVPDEVEVISGLTPATLHRLLDDRTGQFDLLLVSRPGNLRSVLSARPAGWLQVPILYDAEALWATRTALQRAVQGQPLSAQAAARLLQDEIDLARAAAHVMAVNDAEAALFREGGCTSVSIVSHGFAATPTPRGWADRADLLFVGALDDDPSPNADALAWFVREVMPLLQAQRPAPIRLLVAGRSAAPSVRACAGPQVMLLGQVQDLTDLYDSARVFVAPHRYAAGIPTKVLEAAAHGLPCVCSDLLAGQLGWSNGQEVLSARTAAELAAAVMRLDTDPVLWNETRTRALAGLARRFSEAQFDSDLGHALKAAIAARQPAPARGLAVAAGVPAAPPATAAPQPLAVRARRAAGRLADRLREQLRHGADAWRVGRCEAFDRDWYLRMYPDVAAAGADPALHYLAHGAAEGRDPGPNFSTMGYLSRHPEAAQRGRNPLLHFMDHGAAQGHGAGPRAQRVERSPHVVLICGEPGSVGVDLRVTQLAAALAAHGATTAVLTIEQAGRQLQELAGASVLVLWRAAWDESVARLVKVARQGGACVLFDADDLVIEATLARTDVIDGIRTQQLTEDEVQAYFARTLRTFEAADFASCSTERLAAHMRVRGKPTFVLPNGFSDEVHWRSRLALRRRRALPDGLVVRIGYAAGTRTHQRDFALAAAALATVLRQRPDSRLVLFKDRDGKPLVDLDEFSGFEGLEAQIEWRRWMPAAHLAEELARWDINIAPVETGNPFCESKSELKFVDAALVGVCTVASPTDPFARAIEHGHSGFLADSAERWLTTLLHLVDDADLRRRVADAAYRRVLWPHGPRRRAEMAGALLDQMLAPARTAARSAALEMRRSVAPGVPAPPAAKTIFEADRLGQADVTVVVPLHNYAQFIVEALDSVAAQTVPALDLVVVDDASTDASLAVAADWVQRHAARFNRVLLLQHDMNAGLGATRNTAIDRAETPFVLPLDADDRLLPTACDKLLATLHAGGADFAYPLIQQFGDGSTVMGAAAYCAQRFVGGNFISAIAMIRKETWAAVGGFADIEQGWEDFDFWCKLVEAGLWGQQQPEVLAEYRVHGASMTRRTTELAPNKQALLAEMRRRHPWLSLPPALGVAVPTDGGR